MSESDREHLKEQYIKEFRERKKFRQSVESAKKTQTINHALGNMVDILDSTGGTADEFTARLDAETALNEARLEIALESEPHVKKPAAPNSNSVAGTADPPAKTIGRRLKHDPPSENA